MMRNRISASMAALLTIGCLVFLSANLSFAGTVNLPRTGQTTCYDTAGNVISCEGTGQDGDIQAGVEWPNPRFTDNGDGTITDNLTGLMWLKDGNCFGGKTWQEALDAVADLNANPGNYSCGGYTAAYNDWRLPNVNELESLINAEEPNMAVWLNDQGFMNVKSGYYWSSTTYALATFDAWIVPMDSGDVGLDFKDYHYFYAWPVRAGQTGSTVGLNIKHGSPVSNSKPVDLPRTGQTTCYDTAGNVISCEGTGQDGDIQAGVEWPNPRFTDNGDGTITDNLTGLMWLKDGNCFGGKTWQEALDAVADLNANPGNYSCGGYTAAYNDWRLPNRKGLHSLTDYSQIGPALPEGAPFLNVQPRLNIHWSSSTFANSTDYVWAIRMYNGAAGHFDKSSNNYVNYYDMYVWPVRAGQTGPVFTLDIKANGQNGPIIVSSSTLVSITISLRPGNQAGQNADWWIAADTPFGWYSYVYPTGWMTGINLCIRTPLFDLSPSFEVLNTTLPIGQYLFYFAVDDNADGLLDATWLDSVKVNVQATNSPPSSTIASPSNGTTFTQGDGISFIGSGTDPEDGQLTGNSLIWASNKDGQIGTGQSFTKTNLSVNTHTITLTAKDSKDATGTDSVTITVASTSCSDPHEPNDSFAQARYLGDSQGSSFYKELGINSYICSASDVDYFKFVVNSSVFLLYIFEAEGSYGKDYDIYLYDSSYNEIAKSATRPLSGGVNIETIDYLSPSQGTYYIKVVGYNGAYATDRTYMLSVAFASD